jgi:hypothetical protein
MQRGLKAPSIAKRSSLAGAQVNTHTHTLPVQMTIVDVNKQLDSVEADLGIDQGWTADLEDKDGNRVDVVGHREALALTLRDLIEDMTTPLVVDPPTNQQLGGHNPSTDTMEKGSEKYRAC